MKHLLKREQLDKLFQRPKPPAVADIAIKNPKKPRGKVKEIRGSDDFAFRPPDPKLPAGFVNVGGIPIKIENKRVEVPRIRDIRDLVLPRPWTRIDWRKWITFLPTVNPCTLVPSKPARVDISVAPLTRMCQASNDCARIFTVNDSGQGCVINVVTELVEAGFTVQPNPSPNPPYPGDLPASPVVHPFAKGGVNHKYKRLYVPASFYTQVRNADWGGFYVAVVDIDPTSATYLDTVSWIDCEWIPEEVYFTADGETGVIANYMQGTATIFRASDGVVLDSSVDCFPGAGAGGGGPFARSVRTANVPGKGNRAFVTLTTSTPSPGVAIIDLDNPAFPVTNFTNAAFGFITGVGITPEQDRILLVQSSELHVVRVDGASPNLEQTIALPTADGQSYWGGIGVRPSGNMAFAATGSANSSSPTQGTTLAQVGYDAPYAFDMPTNLAPQAWNVLLVEFGNPLKPHIITCSLSGEVSIIPC